MLFPPRSSQTSTSLGLSNVALANQPFAQDYSGNMALFPPVWCPEPIRPLWLSILLLWEKSTSQKGKLLQAVLEAGPVLQTLTVAGPLRRQLNPLPIQAFHILPVSIKSDAESLARVAKPVNQPYAQMHMLLTSLLSFGSGPSGSSVGSGRLVAGGSTASNCNAPVGKRQRFQ
ncbi:hypothetical protein RJ639_008669 [Escallonia herrerae]|uniref:Uncharacterized protein n=1 Tax=Escallonia herrerae TaxID=1293975 RepID=A0AA88VRK7_9ASTE|nr:hypothetical protein RJ639_008669 [Escallonia herrerae]